jgi:hypothetical protein
VLWNGAARTTTFVSTSQLTAAITAADVANAGSASITVSTPSPGGGTSAPKTLIIAGATPTSLTVYGDSLAAGWGNASWTATVNFANTSPVHSGADSIGLTVTGAWGALYVYTNPVDLTPFKTFTFSAQASTAGQSYIVALVDTTGNFIQALLPLTAYGGDPVVGAWKTYNIPLTDLGANGKQIGGIVIQDGLGKAQPIVYLDDIAFK